MKNFKMKFYAVIAALVILFYMTLPYWSYKESTVNITGYAVKQYQHGDTLVSKYIVLTDHGAFENTDTWYYFKFNSSDLQAAMSQPGQYKIGYYGFRVPFFSGYQNIISATKYTTLQIPNAK